MMLPSYVEVTLTSHPDSGKLTSKNIACIVMVVHPDVALYKARERYEKEIDGVGNAYRVESVRCLETIT